ncbi:MAG: hypothetical protein Q9202_005627 [Teloschistes flavicans]
MPRAPAGEHGEPHRKSRSHYEVEEDLGYDDDEAAYDMEEPPAPPRRAKGGRKPPPQYVADDYDDEEEGEVYERQMVIHEGKKKAKSSGKEVARRPQPKHESSEGEEEDSTDTEMKNKKKKGKKKEKARRSEVIEKKAWEPCPFQDIDPPFLHLMARTLHLQEDKLMKYIDKGKVERHTETGEYNIDALLDGGYVPDKAKSEWKAKVKELKRDPKKARILHCSAVADGDGMAAGPSRTPGYGPSTYSYGRPTVVAMGHGFFEPNCYECQLYGIPCGYQPY